MARQPGRVSDAGSLYFCCRQLLHVGHSSNGVTQDQAALASRAIPEAADRLSTSSNPSTWDKLFLERGSWELHLPVSPNSIMQWLSKHGPGISHITSPEAWLDIQNFWPHLRLNEINSEKTHPGICIPSLPDN